MIINRNKLRHQQLKDINSLIARLSKSHFYSQYFSRNQIDFTPLSKVEEINQFPFTTKKDLLKTSPWERSLQKQENIVRCHATSGTTDDPLIILYSRKDIEQWSFLTERILLSNGVSAKDKVQISFGYGLFTGGLGFHYGVERLGAMVIPMSTGNTLKQIKMMHHLKASVLLCTPSYANYLAEHIIEHQIKNLSLKKIICGGERLNSNFKKKIEQKLNVLLYENYGLTEMYGPGVAFETEKSALLNSQNEIQKKAQYLYINEDHFLPEIVNPLSGEILKDGEEGELVLTCLKTDATPLIRYRTGDITHLLPIKKGNNPYSEFPFRCIAKISHRSDDLIILKGVNFYPQQIEDVLKEWKEISSIYEIHLVTENHKDMLQLHLEKKSCGENLKIKIAQKIQQIISLKPMIVLHSPNTLKRFEGKRKIIYDQREGVSEL